MGQWSIETHCNDGTHDYLCEMSILDFENRIEEILTGRSSVNNSDNSVIINKFLDNFDEFNYSQTGVATYAIYNYNKLSINNLVKALNFLEKELDNSDFGWKDINERKLQIKKEIAMIKILLK